jgi:hypothetical protein
MSGPKRNPDKLNTIGVVVVGICGAVLVYVTIVALQAFYMNNTSELQTMADYGGQDMTAKGRKADEMRNITEPGKNTVGEGQQATFRVPIDVAMQKIVEDVKKSPDHLVPALPPSTKASIEPVFGRPKPAAPPAADPAAPPAGGAAAPAAPPAGGAAAPAAPTGPGGQPGAPQPTAGTGGVPAGNAQPPQGQATGQPATGTTAKPAQPEKVPAQPKAPAQPQPKAPAQPQPKAQPKQPAPTNP